MKITESITLDLSGQYASTAIHAKQGDRGTRSVSITLVDGQNSYIPPQGCTARLRVSKPDGTVTYDDCTVNPDGTITAPLSEQALTAEGMAVADVQLIQDNRILASANFIIRVAATPFGTKASSRSESYFFNDLVDRAERAAGNAAGSELTAERFAGQAATSAQDAKTAAQTASEAAGRAETAQKSIVGTEGRVNATAKQVSADALTAQTARDDALTHRQAAEGALGEAQASAVRAENAALDADQSETAAKTAAQNAAGSAQSAAESQRLAGVSEQNAAAYAAQTAEDRTQTGLDRAAVDSAATDIAQSIGGVAQDITARRLLDQQAQTNRLLSTLKPDDGSTSALNGFALSLGKNREVILTYTDPVSGDVYAPATIPTDDTAAELAAEQRLLNGWVADIAKMMEEDEYGT